jgi:hypothetical protein
MSLALRFWSVVVVALLLVFAVGFAQAGMFRENPIDKLSVLKWNAGTPADADYYWQSYFKLAGSPWTEFGIDNHEILPGDCMAYSRGLTVKWKSCYVDGDGAILHLVDEPEVPACIKAELAPFTEACTRIYNVAGQEFAADHVARWNAEHVTTPTP